MRKYKIIWEDEVFANLENIWSYIAFDSVIQANTIILKIQTDIERLESDPLIGQIEDFLVKYNLGHRYLLSGNYKIIYRVAEDFIFIITIFDTRQDPAKMQDII